MQDKRLHVVVGLPRAGKSTLCRQLGFPIVETDAIRKALRCFPFVPEREPEVFDIAEKMVASLFFAGHTDVILDDTSHTSRGRMRWIEYDCIYHEVRTSKEECQQRAMDRDQTYLVPVIEMMAAELTWPLDCKDKINSSGVAVPRNTDFKPFVWNILGPK